MSTTPQTPPALDVPAGSAVARQMRYLLEAEARLGELKIRVRNAKHCIRRRYPADADNELTHLINEAQKLQIHLAAWREYVIPPNTQGQPTPHQSHE